MYIYKKIRPANKDQQSKKVNDIHLGNLMHLITYWANGPEQINFPYCPVLSLGNAVINKNAVIPRVFEDLSGEEARKNLEKITRSRHC